jgi:outer membrane protein
MKKLTPRLCTVRVTALALFSLLLHSGFAQTNPETEKYSFSLQQAIEYAAANQTQMLNAAYDEQIAKEKVRETIGIGLPQIGGNISAQDLLRIPTSVIPAKAFNPYASEDDFMAVQFGIQYNASVGAEVTQLVFSSDYLVGLQATKTFLELSRKMLQRTKIETAVAVSKAYYSVLLNEERLKLLNANADRIKKLFDDTKALNKNGVVEKIDLDRIEVAYNNLLTEKEKITKLMALGYSLLKFQVGMKQNANLQLTDKLADVKLDANIGADKMDYGKRVEYSLLQTQRNASQLMLRQNRLKYLPTIALFGALSENAFRTKFNFFNKGAWYPTAVVGTRINVPLFDGLQTHHKTKQAKLELLKSENNLKLLESSIDMEVQNSSIHLQNAGASLSNQKKNITLAEGIYKTAKIKYEQGVGSNLEVMNAETDLKEAQTNYLSALYDALISKIDYDKATGNIK